MLNSFPKHIPKSLEGRVDDWTTRENPWTALARGLSTFSSKRMFHAQYAHYDSVCSELLLGADSFYMVIGRNDQSFWSATNFTKESLALSFCDRDSTIRSWSRTYFFSREDRYFVPPLTKGRGGKRVGQTKGNGTMWRGQGSQAEKRTDVLSVRPPNWQVGPLDRTGHLIKICGQVCSQKGTETKRNDQFISAQQTHWTTWFPPAYHQMFITLRPFNMSLCCSLGDQGQTLIVRIMKPANTDATKKTYQMKLVYIALSPCLSLCLSLRRMNAPWNILLCLCIKHSAEEKPCYCVELEKDMIYKKEMN